MRVAIAVAGRFHMFELARQLHKRGYLSQLITSYPKFEVVKYGIPRDKIRSIIIKEILRRGWRHAPIFLKKYYDPSYTIAEIFDRTASFKLKTADIVVGMGNTALHTLKKAKAMGAVTVLEHGSSHVLFQETILREEYKKYGIVPPVANAKMTEKRLREIDFADYITIPSFFVKKSFLEQGVSEEKFIHVPYGVDLSSFRQVPKKDNVFRVVFAGGMSLRKGVHYLLKAFAELDLPNSELLLIGSMNNEMKSFFERYRGKYKYIGHVQQRELYKYYSQGSVFMLPSIEEGFALVQLQAAACGLPLVVTTNTGAKDLIRDGVDGFIIPIRDVEAIKEKLLYLYEHADERNEMGKSIKKRVRDGFTWDSYGDKIVREYERVLKRDSV